MADNRNNRPNGDKEPKNKTNLLIFGILCVVLLCSMYFMRTMSTDATQQEVSYSEFMDMVKNGEIESVEIKSDRITFQKKSSSDSSSETSDSSSETSGESAISSLMGDSEVTYYTGIFPDSDLKATLDKYGIKSYSREIPDTTGTIISDVLSLVLPIALLAIFYFFIFSKFSKGGMMGVGKNKAKVYMEKETGVTFKDVAGEDEAKESLVEMVDFLHNPGKYTKIGAKLPKGALLVGPPGTGKTLLAKAVAGEAGVPFFSLSGSDFVEMFVGVGASRVRDLFEEANKVAPCIIFIDEIDAIGKRRDTSLGGGNDEREQTLNQLLAEMDGFDGNKGILILAATNRPEVLDQALLRPGRFDRRVIVDKPDLKGRVNILKVHSKNVKLDETVDMEAIALATSGAVGSDLANMINEAAILAIKHGRNLVSQKDLLEAVEVVLVGKEKKDRILSEEERRIVSYHEVGHALVSALQKDSEPVQKITIVPRTMGALGYVMNVPEEEKYLNTEKEIRAMLVEFVGGRAAEEIVFDTVTTGAANDIEKATKLARAMITQYGMSKKFGLMQLESNESTYLTGRNIMNCSDETATEIDREIKEILAESYEEAKRLLNENRQALDEIAAFLIERETITGKEFMEIFHRVKGIDPNAPKNTSRINEKPVEKAIEAGETQAATEPVIAEIKEDNAAKIGEATAEPAEQASSSIAPDGEAVIEAHAVETPATEATAGEQKTLNVPDAYQTSDEQ